jgi:hypothetical protein
MATYTVRMMDADTGGEGVYSFEAPEELFAATPIRIVKAFMDHVDQDVLPHQHVDYELNAAFKNETKTVVTAMGQLILEHLPPIPFMLMVTRDHQV